MACAVYNMINYCFQVDFEESKNQSRFVVKYGVNSVLDESKYYYLYSVISTSP